MDGGCLRAKDREILEKAGWKSSTGGFSIIRYLTNLIKKEREEGGLPRTGAESDPEVALWMARGCLALGDYEHCRMAVQWLERTGRGREPDGERCLLMARGLMYCGRREAALSWAVKAVEKDPEDAWGWYTAAELLYLAGRKDQALETAEKGRHAGKKGAVRDGAWEQLTEAVRRGDPIEDIERERIRQDAAAQGESGSTAEKKRLEAADGIRKDEAGLQAVKEELRPEIWDSDEPYCAFCFWPGNRELTGAFCMNEAAVSKWKPEELRRILDRLPELEKEGREALGGDGELCLLEFYPDRSAGLIYETEEGERRAVVSRDGTVRAEGETEKERAVTLPEGFPPLRELAGELERDWGVTASLSDGEKTLIFRDGGLTGQVQLADRGENEICLLLKVRGEEGKERDAELELERLTAVCAYGKRSAAAGSEQVP